MNLSIACADVRSEASDNFGWAVCDVPGAVEEVPLRAADYDVVSRAQAVWRIQFHLVARFTLAAPAPYPMIRAAARHSQSRSESPPCPPRWRPRARRSRRR